MSAIPPERVGIGHLRTPPEYIAFRTRRGGIWFGGKLIFKSPGDEGAVGTTGSANRVHSVAGGKHGTSNVDSLTSPGEEPKANGTTARSRLPMPAPTTASVAVTTGRSPNTLALTDSSTPADDSSVSPCSSSFLSRSIVATPSLAVALSVTTPGILGPSTIQDGQTHDQHVVETYYGRRLRRYDTEVAPISEREYQHLVFREQNVARKAYAFKRDALLRRRVQLAAELGGLGGDCVSTACDPVTPRVAHSASSTGLLDASGAFPETGLVLPTLPTPITQGPSRAPSQPPSAAIVHAAAAYAYRVTRRIDDLQGDDVVVSPFGRQVVVRDECDIDEMWHGDCDGEVIEAFLASLRRRDTRVCDPESVQVSPAEMAASDTEWSFCDTSIESGSDIAISGALDVSVGTLHDRGILGQPLPGPSSSHGATTSDAAESITARAHARSVVEGLSTAITSRPSSDTHVPHPPLPVDLNGPPLAPQAFTNAVLASSPSTMVSRMAGLLMLGLAGARGSVATSKGEGSNGA